MNASCPWSSGRHTPRLDAHPAVVHPARGCRVPPRSYPYCAHEGHGSPHRASGAALRAGASRAHGTDRPLLVYLHDPYCAWSYGYLPALRSLMDEVGGEADLETVNIGLFRGDSVTAAAPPMQAVRRATGATFGPGYELALADATMTLYSRAAAAAVIGLTTAAPTRELEVIEALQRAFFWDGRDLSDPETVRVVADHLGLDGPAIGLFSGSPRAAELADDDMLLARDLGARRGPTLLVSHRHHLSELEGPGTTGEQLVEQFRGVLARP